MLTQGRVVVNDEVVHRAKTTVFTGDTVEVLERQRAEERTPPPTTGPPVDLDVLYEDGRSSGGEQTPSIALSGDGPA